MKHTRFMQEERLQVLQHRIGIPFDGASPEHQVFNYIEWWLKTEVFVCVVH
jgi:hypothetical protein